MADNGHSLRLWIAGACGVAVVGLIIDQSTGDTTGPPYNDSLLNQAAFLVFFGAMILFLGLCVLAFVRWTRGRLAQRE